MKRRLQAGIDYGTSASKVAVRDYGAAGSDVCHVMLADGSPRHSSAVAVKSNAVVFGDDALALRADPDWCVYESIKMRMLGHCVDGRFELPHPDLDWQALAIGSIWWLISRAEEFATQLAGRNHALGMTIGVPRAYMKARRERSLFLTAARAAWQIFKREGSLNRSLVTAVRLASLCDDARAKLPAIAPEYEGEWIRSEAEAAMWWAFNSPSVAIGPYAKVDVGAGTTNASVFRITGTFQEGRWVKTGLAFFGAHSEPAGMDDVCHSLFEAGDDREVRTLFDLRGREAHLFQQARMVAACDAAFERIGGPFREAWRQMWVLNRGSAHEMRSWQSAAMTFLGGGAALRPLTNHLRQHPQNGEPLPLLSLESPPRLLFGGSAPPRDALRFLLVAYGLSTIGLEVPEALGPDEIPPLEMPAARAARLTHEEIYGHG